jgi:hypothetical protein
VTDAATTGDGPPVVLIYDTQTLVLLNRSDGAVDISGLRFVRTNQIGREIAFEAFSWADTTAVELDQMPAGGCFQVWLISLNVQPTPDYCRARFGWEAVGTTRQFWVSSQEDLTFEARRGTRVIAICPTNGGECELDL